MSKILERVWVKKWIDVKAVGIAETAAALSVAIVTPMLLAHTPNNQFIVGTIVNAVLFWTALRVGLLNAVVIGVVPSLIALTRGLLPPTAAALIPFIILGNATLVFTFSAIKLKLVWRVIASSIAKFIVIALPLWVGFELAPVVKVMMSWPQLVTALAGGFGVIAAVKFIQKRKKADTP